MRSAVHRFGLYGAWIVSLVATGGSLYFSEVRGFIPCELCWYQRILMYPLAIVLGIASYHQDRRVARYALPLAGVGWCISTFHYLVQQGVVSLSAMCSPDAPCSGRWINGLGFITIPLLAWTAFALIGALVWMAYQSDADEPTNEAGLA